MNHCFITHFTSAPASVYSHFHRTDWRLCHLITLSTTGRPAVVESGLRTPHLCFVCIIKETRSKLMKRYRPKLLWRKWGTMSNLRPLLVSAALAVRDVAAVYHGHLHLSIPSFETQSIQMLFIWCIVLCPKYPKYPEPCTVNHAVSDVLCFG